MSRNIDFATFELPAFQYTPIGTLVDATGVSHTIYRYPFIWDEFTAGANGGYREYNIRLQNYTILGIVGVCYRSDVPVVTPIGSDQNGITCVFPDNGKTVRFYNYSSTAQSKATLRGYIDFMD